MPENGQNIRIFMYDDMLAELRTGVENEQKRRPGERITLSSYVRSCIMVGKQCKDLEAEEQ